MTVVDSGVFVDLLAGALPVDRFGAVPLEAPHLVDSEFLNAVRGLVHGAVVAEAQAERMIARFGDLRIQRYSTDRSHQRIWELRNNLTAYDATYVALAEQLDTTLVTRDARIARAPGVRCPVVVL